MTLKKILMIGVVGSVLGFSPAKASVCMDPMPCFCAYTYACAWMELLANPVGFIVREWNEKIMTPTYDVHDGLERIKRNIGMYQDQGECGISATGNTGCDLTTPEQGAEEDAQMAAQEAVIPPSTVDIIYFSETGKVTINGKEVDATKIGLDGEDVDEETKKKLNSILSAKGSTFDQVRANVTKYIFRSDDDEVNKSCKCTTKIKGKCDPTECAQTRQNDALFVSSLGASARADTYLEKTKMDENWSRLANYIKEVNGSGSQTTLADFVGRLGKLSVYASSLTTDIMALHSHELRSQSYRNLVFGGTDPVDLSKDLKKETKSGGTK